jgi:ABC-type phosphate transport system substrate-binding protein
MKRGRILLGMGVTVVTLGAWGTVSADASGGGGPTAQSVLGSGSNTTQLMMANLDTLYLFSPGCSQIPDPVGPTAWLDFSCQSPDPTGTIQSENYEHDQVHEAYFLGSSNGIAQLCDQGQPGVAVIQYARSSRAPGASDCSGLHFVAYARDGIPIEGFGANATSYKTSSAPCKTTEGFCITQTQAKAIWHTCTITNWDQLDPSLPSATIDMYTPQPGSGTRSTFDTFLGGTNFSETCIDLRGTAYEDSHVIPENSNVPIIANGDQNDALFPFSFGAYETTCKGCDSSHLAKIDGIAASATTIGNLTFPYGRYLYNVVACGTVMDCGSHASWLGSSTTDTAAQRYVGEQGWICSTTHVADPNSTKGTNYTAEIAAAIKSFGFVPIAKGVIGGGDTNSDVCRLFIG